MLQILWVFVKCREIEVVISNFWDQIRPTLMKSNGFLQVQFNKNAAAMELQ
jgi:hypothetical protein